VKHKARKENLQEGSQQTRSTVRKGLARGAGDRRTRAANTPPVGPAGEKPPRVAEFPPGVRQKVGRAWPPADPDPAVTRTWVAYHEAGHAVFAWWYDQALEVASIEGDTGWVEVCQTPDPYTPEILSQMCLMDGPERRERVGEAVEADVAVILAGSLAELHYRGIQLTGLLAGDGDPTQAWELLAAWGRAQRGVPIPRHLIMEIYGVFLEVVIGYLHRPKIWRAVEALAQALLKEGTLDGEEASAIISRAYGQRRRAPIFLLASRDR
jgi:hypothetical protein